MIVRKITRAMPQIDTELNAELMEKANFFKFLGKNFIKYGGP